MVDHAALGALAAGVRARVDTLVAVAVLVAGTVRVHDALGLAGDPRVAEVLGKTLAVCVSVVFDRALSVGSAR